MTISRTWTGAAVLIAALAAAIATFALIAPAAQAKSAPLDGHLVSDATQRGSKVEAPVLLSGQSAKKLKLRSPLALLVVKSSKGVPVPNPAGNGKLTVAPRTLRSGDVIEGKGKLKGDAKKLMPVVKPGKLEVTDRESAYSVDEVTAALAALYGQVGALGLRVDALESGLAALRAEIDALKAQNASLTGQLNALLAQIADLEAALDALTSLVGGLPTAADLQAVIDAIADLQSQIDALGLADADLQDQLDALSGQLTTLTGTVNLICGTLPVC